MLRQLRAARADQSFDRRMLRFTGPDVLIIDDLGLRPLEGDEPIELYEIFMNTSSFRLSSMSSRHLPPHITL